MIRKTAVEVKNIYIKTKKKQQQQQKPAVIPNVRLYGHMSNQGV